MPLRVASTGSRVPEAVASPGCEAKAGELSVLVRDRGWRNKGAESTTYSELAGSITAVMSSASGGTEPSYST